MGCGGSKDAAAPPPAQAAPVKTGGYRPPPPPDPEELERQRQEAEQEARWLAEAKRQLPEPFPKPSFNRNENASEEAYKEYMRQKFEYEAWENRCILLGRKLRAENS